MTASLSSRERFWLNFHCASTRTGSSVNARMPTIMRLR